MTGSPIPPGQMPDYLYAPVFGSLYVDEWGQLHFYVRVRFLSRNGQDELRREALQRHNLRPLEIDPAVRISRRQSFELLYSLLVHFFSLRPRYPRSECSLPSSGLIATVARDNEFRMKGR